MVTGLRGLFESLSRFMSISVCKNTSVKIYKVKQAHISFMKKTKKIKKRGKEGKGRIVGGIERGREERKTRERKKKVSIHFCYFSSNSGNSQHLTRNLSINDTQSHF